MAEQKKTAAGKSGTSTGKKSASSRKKTSGSSGSAASRESTSSRRASAPRTEPSRKQSGRQVADAAARQLGELTSKEVEAVTGLERTEDGWTVEVEVLELRRVPNTTDVLATYEVRVDSDGELEGYHRSHRYVRGTPGEGT